jgi:DNA-binding NarL/FixJ family response regulator
VTYSIPISSGEVKEMVGSITHMSRKLSPVEHLILKLVCHGQSNAYISENTHYPVKTVENTISRSARVFGVTSTPNTNLRVLLAIAYRVNFGEIELEAKNIVVKEVSTPGHAA